MKEWFLLYFGASASLVLLLAFGWIRASRRARRLEDRLFEILAGEARSDGLEQVVESLTAQVDRLAKGQEFLSDRLGRAQLGRPRNRLE